MKNEAYYLQKEEQIKTQSKDKAFMVIETLNTENVYFMLRDNHLTIEAFLAEINHIYKIVKEYVVNVEDQVNYYKDELIVIQIRFEELKCRLVELKRDLEIKTYTF